MNDEQENQRTFVIIGGGAAGIFCAVNLARLSPESKVIVLEKTSKLLSKVKVSGGGRCNVTHDHRHVSEMLAAYPRGDKFLKKAFQQFFVKDTVQWFAERGVRLKTEEDGRMFPVTDDSQTVIDCLLSEAKKFNVSIRTNVDIKDVQKAGDGFEIQTANETFRAQKIMLAMGGRQLRDIHWTNSTGHKIIPQIPSLFTFNLPHHPITELMGLVKENAEVKIAGEKMKSAGPVLITHWGLSGPGILKLSAFAAELLAAKQYTATVIVNWAGEGETEHTVNEHIKELREQNPARLVKNASAFNIPSRLWAFLLKNCDIDPEVRWDRLALQKQNRLVKNIAAFEVQMKGKTTFKEEFVTAGGIDTAEVDPVTMESRLVPGLYFGGEMLNVDGITGGYNFQNAWTTGYIAATAMAL